MSWHLFASADPEFAAFGKERLHDKVAYLATIRADGAPRLERVQLFGRRADQLERRGVLPSGG